MEFISKKKVVWCLMLFSTVFQLYCSSQCTCPFSPRVLLTSTPDNILSKPLAAFPQNIVETMDSGERGLKHEGK